MWSRRYLRRSLTIVLILPIILLVLFAIYQNRSAIFSNDSLHNQQANHQYHFHHEQHKEYHKDKSRFPKMIDNKRQQNDFQSKHTISVGNPLPKVQLNEEKQVIIESKPTPFIKPFSAFNNYERFQIGNSFRPISLLNENPSTLDVIETKDLERFIHLDLKGAAPKVDYYEKLFPYLKQLGANGLLIEYEDMFPFSKNLSVLRHDFAYSTKDIQKILKLAEDNKLKVMPLIQVYGHLEYVLKLKEFMHLREDKRYPQVITPCLEESYKLLFEMIDQLLLEHPAIPYLHIGCDEVYYRLIHPQCASLNFRDEADLFIRHVTRVAKYVKSKRPQIKLFIWHDMISQLLNSGFNNTTELIELVVPMMWAYVDDVKPWFDDSVWMRFASFPEVWVASSYKGSSGEITTVNYIGHHQRNQQTWLETMYIASRRFKVNFTGVAITGWSRYDHMLSLCELLPSSIPSLAYNLQTIVHGRLNDQLNQSISRDLLGCLQMPLWERSVYPTYIICKFPGHEMYEAMFEYDNIMRQYEETMGFVRLYVTDIHLRQNYIHYKRAEECFDRLSSLENNMVHFIDAFQNTCSLFFTADIGPEWLQTYFMRIFQDVQKHTNFVERTLKTQSSWLQRPLPKDTSRIVVKKRNITYRIYTKTF